MGLSHSGPLCSSCHRPVRCQPTRDSPCALELPDYPNQPRYPTLVPPTVCPCSCSVLSCGRATPCVTPRVLLSSEQEVVEFCLPSLSITVLCPASKSQNPQNKHRPLPVSLTPCGHDLSCASYHPCPLSHHLNILLPLFPFVPMNSIPTSPQKPVRAPLNSMHTSPCARQSHSPFIPCAFSPQPLSPAFNAPQMPISLPQLHLLHHPLLFCIAPIPSHNHALLLPLHTLLFLIFLLW